MIQTKKNVLVMEKRLELLEWLKDNQIALEGHDRPEAATQASSDLGYTITGANIASLERASKALNINWGLKNVGPQRKSYVESIRLLHKYTLWIHSRVQSQQGGTKLGFFAEAEQLEQVVSSL